MATLASTERLGRQTSVSGILRKDQELFPPYSPLVDLVRSNQKHRVETSACADEPGSIWHGKEIQKKHNMNCRWQFTPAAPNKFRSNIQSSLIVTDANVLPH